MGVGHAHAGPAHVLDALQNGYGLLAVAGAAPGANHVHGAVSQRTHPGNVGRVFQRQGLVVVFEQHEAAAGHIAGSLHKVGLHKHLLGPGLGHATVGVREQAQAVLGFEHAAAGLVYISLFHGAFLEVLGQVFQKNLAHHVLVHAGVQGQPRHFFVVAEAVRAHLIDGRVVRHHEALKAPLPAQQIGHQPAVGGGRNPIDVIK